MSNSTFDKTLSWLEKNNETWRKRVAHTTSCPFRRAFIHEMMHCKKRSSIPSRQNTNEDNQHHLKYNLDCTVYEKHRSGAHAFQIYTVWARLWTDARRHSWSMYLRQSSIPLIKIGANPRSSRLALGLL